MEIDLGAGIEVLHGAEVLPEIADAREAVPAGLRPPLIDENMESSDEEGQDYSRVVLCGTGPDGRSQSGDGGMDYYLKRLCDARSSQASQSQLGGSSVAASSSS